MFKELNILSVFFEQPTREFSVRDVAKAANVSPATASKHLQELSEKGILKYRQQKITDFYKSDLDNEYYRDIKIFFNIREIRESGFLESLNKFYAKPTVILFGSASNGMDVETSDMDFVVVSERTSTFPFMEQFGRKLKREIHIFPVKKIMDLKNPNLINNVLNGIIIQGELKWK